MTNSDAPKIFLSSERSERSKQYLQDARGGRNDKSRDQKRIIVYLGLLVWFSLLVWFDTIIRCYMTCMCMMINWYGISAIPNQNWLGIFHIS